VRAVIDEWLNFIIIIFLVLVVLLFFTAESSLRGAEVSQTLRGRALDESASLALNSLFNNRLERVDKTYIEIMTDAALENRDFVFYGADVGLVRTREIIEPMFDSYLGEGNWRLDIYTYNGNVTYGTLSSREKTFAYSSDIPVPPNLIGKVVLHV